MKRPANAPRGPRPTLAFLAGLLACALLVPAGAAAGEVHPGLEARLRGAAPGTFLPVIVELRERPRPEAAAAAVAFDRRARGRAVVRHLRELAERSQPPVRAALEQERARGLAGSIRSFWVFNGLAAAATEPAIRRLAARPDVREVRLDAAIPPPVPRPAAAGTAAAVPAWNIEIVRAPQAWALGAAYSGTGIVVGSFDTGVDGSHPELAPRYRGNDAISWFDPYGEHASPYDNHGHGTHTTGTIVGGDASGYGIGVAPGARWIAAKAWSDAEEATESAFHRIFEWFLAPGGDPANAPHVVNSSWGLDPALCFPDFRDDVRAFRAAGIVPVFAAGNSGPDAGSVLAPGSYAESFTVGATDFYDEIAFFSGQGPSNCDGATKPNVSAPGSFILSTLPGANYAYLDGTSMAAPHVSGAAAVLLSIDPGLTVAEVEAALAAGAVDLGPPGPDNAFGHGRLDVLESARIVLGLEKVGIVATVPRAFEAGVVAGRFTVSRTGGTEASLVVAYTVSGDAVPGEDYLALPGTLTIPAGASSATLEVVPVDDNLGELDETVVVTLDAGADYVIGPAQATVVLESDEVPPDLVVTALAVPPSAGAGDAIAISDTTRNQGSAPSTPSATVYFLSSDGLLDEADVRLGSRPVPALAPGAADSGGRAVTIPAGIAGGRYWLIARADGDDALVETQEANNALTRTLLVGADLAMTTLTVPLNGGAGLALAIADTTRNQGAGAAPATLTSFHLSRDAILDGADAALGSRALPALAAGASSSGTTTLTIPEGTPTGTYYLYARADGGDAVAETYENNNATSRTLRVGPDLVLPAFTVPSGAGAGTAFEVTDTVRNAGGGAGGASRTRYYLSANSLLDGSDVALGGRDVPAIGPGATHSGPATLTIPAGTPGGLWYLIAQADGEAHVEETLEGNNILARSLPVGPDLAIAGLTAPATGGAGLAVTLADTTRNAGAGAAAASTTSFYLSANAVLDAADALIGSRSVAALEAGSASAGATTAMLPPDAATGTYYVFARADAQGAVVETNEGNNHSSRTLRIGPDLALSGFSAPASAAAAAGIPVTITATNSGGGTAGPSTTRFYLSANSQLDAADVAIGARDVPPLAPGASDTGSATLAIPEGTGGIRYLIAVADGDASVSETQEANNTLARSILVGPDLVLSGLTVPINAGAGLAITLADTTRNQGAGAAPASLTTWYLSANATIDAADPVLGARDVPALAAGATHSGSVVVTVPADTPAGSYYLYARADAGDAVAETYENNNATSRTLRVGPDLVFASFTVPASAAPGSTVDVADGVRNAGGGAAAASATRYYLSANSVLDAADVPVGLRAVASLAPGAADTGAATVEIPAGTAAGTWYLIAKADGDSAVPETFEANNTIPRSLQVVAP